MGFLVSVGVLGVGCCFCWSSRRSYRIWDLFIRAVQLNLVTRNLIVLVSLQVKKCAGDENCAICGQLT
jgi:hypothetical protein